MLLGVLALADRMHYPCGMNMQAKPQAAGGNRRAQVLSPEQRKAIASKAALVKAGYPQATHSGVLRIGDLEVDCHVLKDGRRLLTQESFLTVMGRAAKAKGGHGVLTTVDKTPPFLAASNLKPLIEKEISESTTPVEFISTKGPLVRGYAAELLPQVCRVYLSARDEGTLLPSQRHVAERADILVRALASIGIVSLVDEATGYQDVRDRQALQALLDRYLLAEYAAWAKRFPDEFFREMFRLKGWKYPTVSGGKPGVVGRYINDLVYERLAPGLLQELQDRNPKNESGNRITKHHQWLTPDTGHPALTAHLHATMGLMRVADSWEQLKLMMDRAFPKKGDTMPLLLE